MSCIAWVEVKPGRKLNWLVGDLHTNELPLLYLITTLDGRTMSNNKWTGDIGKMLDNATELKINHSFTKLSIGELLISLSDDVVKDLSTDQSYGYRITQAIRTGELLTDLTLLEIGPVSHSRWLTTANRLCRMWVSNHGLIGKTLNNLKLDCRIRRWRILPLLVAVDGCSGCCVANRPALSMVCLQRNDNPGPFVLQ